MITQGMVLSDKQFQWAQTTMLFEHASQCDFIGQTIMLKVNIYKESPLKDKILGKLFF